MNAPRPVESLMRPLDQLRRNLRRALILESLLLFLLAVVVAFAVGLLLDYELFLDTGFDWVLDAPAWLRGLVLGGFVVLVGGWALNRIVFSGRGHYSYAALALLLEKRFPDVLSEKLITAVELADVKEAERVGYSPELVRRTIDDAGVQLAKINPGTIVRRGRFVKLTTLILLVLGGTLSVLTLRNALLLGSLQPKQVLTYTVDTVTIWGERNILLRHVPWLRQGHLEIIEPTRAEHRIGRDGAAPQIRVRSYQWLIADRTTRLGWRPLKWGDLGDKLAIDVPSTIQQTETPEFTDAERATGAVAGGNYFALFEKQPIAVNVSLASLSVDEVTATFGAEHPTVTPVLATLTERAAQFSESRTLRRLADVDTVQLRYFGIAKSGSSGSRGQVKLTREANGEHSVVLTSLKESISYTVRTNDFRTDPQVIVLVPPPLLTELKRSESVPAYLYHPAPVAEGAAQWNALKPLRQKLPPKDFSLTGEKSIAPIPVGSEVEIFGTADKELAEVLLIPKTGRLPSTQVDNQSVRIQPEGASFRFAFRGDERLQQTTEFELVLVDLDGGVRSRRNIVLQAVDDAVPEVRVAVQVLREFNNGYLCTPKAMVPFLKESIIRDDTGLSRVDYEFQLSRVESQAVQALQFEAYLGVYGFVPSFPHFGSGLGPLAITQMASSMGQGEQKQSGRLTVRAFERAYDALTKQSVADLLRSLDAPREKDNLPGVVREVRFSLDSDVFDLLEVDAMLEARGRRMLANESNGEVQQRFRMDLNVAAVDTNIVQGPRIGKNLETIRLFIVSEADLLAEITTDEEKITKRFDEALRRLRDTQVKLNGLAELLRSASVNQQALLSARVRAEDMTQELAKSRDLLQNVINEYTKLKLEVETNRCNVGVAKRYDTVMITPLDSVLAQEHKAADAAMDAYRETFVANSKPDDDQTTRAKVTLDALIRRLEQIRRELGDTLSEAKLRDDLRKIIENQKSVSEALARTIKGSREKLFAPEIKPVADVTIERGASVKVTHGIDWKIYDKGDIKIRLEASNGSDIKVPDEIVVKDDKDDFEYTLTAGKTVGTFRVTLTPTIGASVVVNVVVK